MRGASSYKALSNDSMVCILTSTHTQVTRKHETVETELDQGTLPVLKCEVIAVDEGPLVRS